MAVINKQTGMFAGTEVDRKYVELDARREHYRLVSRDMIPARSGDSVQSRADPGDYAEFVADMDLIVAVSACPVGDYAVPMDDPRSVTARPLVFEIYDTN